MNRPVYAALLLLITLGALALRLPDLARRPLHNDEGVNTVKFNDLRTSGRFDYDPNEYHGPTLYYLTLPVVWITGEKDFAATTEVTYRIVPVVFGIGLILLLPLVSDGIGRGGVLWAALFTAVSPAFVYYSRYYIHEVPLVFFVFAAVACGWRYRRSNHLGWAAACGVFVGLTYATKETWILAFAAAGASAVLAATIWRFVLKRPHHGLHFHPHALLIGAATFALTFVVLFSGFFTRMRGPLDAILAYFHYSQRASGGIHDHPWYYYFHLLLAFRIKGGPLWTEAAIVALGAAGFCLAVLRRHTPVTLHLEPVPPEHPDHPRFTAFPPFVRFVGFYTLFLAIGFSVIPYKTPWCLLDFHHGMILLAGFACAQVIHVLPSLFTKSLATIVFLAAAAHLAFQADRATNNFLDPKHRGYFAASRYNPYVYAHTSPDLTSTFTKRMDQIAATAPEHERVAIDVYTSDCWPIPFYLRRFRNTAYPTRVEDRRPNADVIIASAEDAAGDPEKKIQAIPTTGPNRYVPSSFGLRPGVVLWLYVRAPLWDAINAARASTP